MLTVGQQVSLKKAFSTLSDVKLVFKKAQDFPCMLRSFGNNNYLPSNVHRQGYRETPIRQMPKKKDNHQKKGYPEAASHTLEDQRWYLQDKWMYLPPPVTYYPKPPCGDILIKRVPSAPVVTGIFMGFGANPITKGISLFLTTS